MIACRHSFVNKKVLKRYGIIVKNVLIGTD